MNEGTRLKFQNPIGDAITRIRFAPKSNNLLISSWDTSLRLYDLDSFMLRVEAPSEAALLDCCFQNESVAFGAGSDSFIRSDGTYCELAMLINYCHDLICWVLMTIERIVTSDGKLMVLNHLILFP
ncbi:unnamed protein product [Camellia sinensis]